MVCVARVMSNASCWNIGSARILKPSLQLRAGCSTAACFAVERSLQFIVDKDELDAITLKPVLEEGPLRGGEYVTGRDSSEGTRPVATSSLIEREVCIPSTLMTAVSREPPAIAITEVMNAYARRIGMPPANRVEGFTNPGDRLQRSPRDPIAPQFVRGMRL